VWLSVFALCIILKQRHYDAEEIRHYIQQKRAERMQKQLEEEKRQKKADELRRKQLEELYTKQKQTANNISAISWQSVLLVEETGVPGETHRPAASH
jgi:hypothetical protein